MKPKFDSNGTTPPHVTVQDVSAATYPRSLARKLLSGALVLSIVLCGVLAAVNYLELPLQAFRRLDYPEIGIMVALITAVAYGFSLKHWRPAEFRGAIWRAVSIGIATTIAGFFLLSTVLGLLLTFMGFIVKERQEAFTLWCLGLAAVYGLLVGLREFTQWRRAQPAVAGATPTSVETPGSAQVVGDGAVKPEGLPPEIAAAVARASDPTRRRD